MIRYRNTLSAIALVICLAATSLAAATPIASPAGTPGASPIACR